MKPALAAPESVLASLESGYEGLAAAVAARRLAEFGGNRIEAAREKSLWLDLAREFTHFFALILWLAAGLAAFAEHAQPGEGMGTLAAAIVGVILVNGLFSFWQSWRAERALAALRELLPARVTVLRDGRPVSLPAEQLVPGDVVALTEGDKVPADCRVLAAAGLRVNLATLTGESRPKVRVVEAGHEADPLAARNLLLAGTLVVSGDCRAVVFATGMRTEFGRIARLAQGAVAAVSPLQTEIRRVSRLVAILAVVLGVAFFVIGRWIGLPFWANFMFAIGIIVANVPEGLLPTVTLALAMATQRMARRNALVRHLPAVEALGSTTVICSDKTGTLTCNRMTVKEAQPAGDPELLRRVAARCHNLRFRDGTALGDPMEVALQAFGSSLPDDGLALAGEIPFDADRRRMSVIYGGTAGVRLYCKGAPETVLPLCSRFALGSGERALDETDRQRLVAEQETMAARGLRVLAMAVGDGEREEGLLFVGLVGLEDPPRPDVPEAVARCREAGIRVVMVTGDYPGTAVAIGREIGLVSGEPRVLLGEQIRNLSPAALQLALGALEVICARVTAEQKMLVVQALQAKGEIVAVTGDGVNDAPALKCADIGIAMGASGTDVAREAADIVLLDDHFASIVNAVEEGRAVYANIRKFLTYILTSNIPELVPYLAFALFRIPLPLTIVQILAVDLGTDMVPALALGAEAPHAGVMREPPRRRGEHLLSWPLLARAYLWLGLLEATAAMAAFFSVLEGGGWAWGELPGPRDLLYLQATTACLAAIVVMQVANVFLCRHPRQPFWCFPLLTNPLLLAGIVSEAVLLLAIVYTPWGNALFGTAPLAGSVWLFILPFAGAMLLLEEGRKMAVRKMEGKTS